jgi:hypothetical protein
VRLRFVTETAWFRAPGVGDREWSWQMPGREVMAAALIQPGASQRHVNRRPRAACHGKRSASGLPTGALARLGLAPANARWANAAAGRSGDGGVQVASCGSGPGRWRATAKGTSASQRIVYASDVQHSARRGRCSSPARKIDHADWTSKARAYVLPCLVIPRWADAQAIDRAKRRPGPGALEHGELLPEQADIYDQARARAKGGNERAEQS